VLCSRAGEKAAGGGAGGHGADELMSTG
jgi:hypothetical protein